MQPQTIDLHFPKAGLDVSKPAGEWPIRIGPNNEKHYYCADSLNVQGYDALTRRYRGGSRPCLAKWLSTQVNGETFIVQELNALVDSGYTPPGGGMAQPHISGRVVTLVAVSEGEIAVMNPGDALWTTPTNNAANDPPLNASGVMQSASLGQIMYFADGLDDFVYYDPVGNTTEDWVLTDGMHPTDADGNGPRLICLWGGRIVRSGLMGDSQDIFMSRINDANDHDYFPADPSAADPVTLSLSEMGTVGDMVTGLVPATDDILVVLCDTSVYRITGNPVDGGRVDLVCQGIGGAFGKAWCKDPAGNIYFFSSIPGVYMLPAGASGQPIRISHQIDPRLRDIDMGNVTIRLFWDDDITGLRVYITPNDVPADVDADDVTHWLYESARPDGSGGGWHPFRFGNTSHNPVCGCVFDGNDANDRVTVIGSWDGYVRYLSPDATDDDGTEVESYVLHGPILTPNMDEVKLEALQGLFAKDSADVDYEILLGDTAEEALTNTVPQLAPRIGTFSQSRGYTKRIKRSAFAIFVKLKSTGRWAHETLKATLGKTLSPKRARGNR